MPALPLIDGWEWRYDTINKTWSLQQTHGRVADLVARLTSSELTGIRNSVSDQASNASASTVRGSPAIRQSITSTVSRPAVSPAALYKPLPALPSCHNVAQDMADRSAVAVHRERRNEELLPPALLPGRSVNTGTQRLPSPIEGSPLFLPSALVQPLSSRPSSQYLDESAQAMPGQINVKQRVQVRIEQSNANPTMIWLNGQPYYARTQQLDAHGGPRRSLDTLRSPFERHGRALSSASSHIKRRPISSLQSTTQPQTSQDVQTQVIDDALASPSPVELPTSPDSAGMQPAPTSTPESLTEREPILQALPATEHTTGPAPVGI